MNFELLNKLVRNGNLSKSQIAKRAHISRTTLDNALNGADVKISTIENVAKVLGVNAGVFFDSEISVACKNLNGKGSMHKQAKIIIEFEINPEEFVEMGLSDKVTKIIAGEINKGANSVKG